MEILDNNSEEQMIETLFGIASHNGKYAVTTNALLECIKTSSGNVSEDNEDLLILRHRLDPDNINSELSFESTKSIIAQWIRDIRTSGSERLFGDDQPVQGSFTGAGDQLPETMDSSWGVSEEFAHSPSRKKSEASNSFNHLEVMCYCHELECSKKKLLEENERLSYQQQKMEDVVSALSKEKDGLIQTVNIRIPELQDELLLMKSEAESLNRQNEALGRDLKCEKALSASLMKEKKLESEELHAVRLQLEEDKENARKLGMLLNSTQERLSQQKEMYEQLESERAGLKGILEEEKNKSQLFLMQISERESEIEIMKSLDTEHQNQITQLQLDLVNRNCNLNMLPTCEEMNQSYDLFEIPYVCQSTPVTSSLRSEMKQSDFHGREKKKSPLFVRNFGDVNLDSCAHLSKIECCDTSLELLSSLHSNLIQDIGNDIIEGKLENFKEKLIELKQDFAVSMRKYSSKGVDDSALHEGSAVRLIHQLLDECGSVAQLRQNIELQEKDIWMHLSNLFDIKDREYVEISSEKSYGDPAESSSASQLNCDDQKESEEPESQSQGLEQSLDLCELICLILESKFFLHNSKPSWNLFVSSVQATVSLQFSRLKFLLEWNKKTLAILETDPTCSLLESCRITRNIGDFPSDLDVAQRSDESECDLNVSNLKNFALPRKCADSMSLWRFSHVSQCNSPSQPAAAVLGRDENGLPCRSCEVPSTRVGTKYRTAILLSCFCVAILMFLVIFGETNIHLYSVEELLEPFITVRHYNSPPS